MSRSYIEFNDLEKYNTGGGGSFLRLSDDGDTARIRFQFNSLNEIAISVHDIQLNGKYRNVACLRGYSDPLDKCPFCAAGMRSKVRLFIPVYDADSEEAKIWSQPKSFASTLSGITGRYKNLVSHEFDIVRHGASGDMHTNYQVFENKADKTQARDLPDPVNAFDFAVMDKSYDDMNYFLEQNDFPPDDDDAPIRRRGMSDDDMNAPYDNSNAATRRTPANNNVRSAGRRREAF